MSRGSGCWGWIHLCSWRPPVGLAGTLRFAIIGGGVDVDEKRRVVQLEVRPVVAQWLQRGWKLEMDLDRKLLAGMQDDGITTGDERTDMQFTPVQKDALDHGLDGRLVGIVDAGDHGGRDVVRIEDGRLASRTGRKVDIAGI